MSDDVGDFPTFLMKESTNGFPFLANSEVSGRLAQLQPGYRNEITIWD